MVKKAYIYVLLGTILFSTMEVTLKTMAGDFHPIQMTMTRFLVGGLFLLPLGPCASGNFAFIGAMWPNSLAWAFAA